MVTDFKDYSELPFSIEIQKELFARHKHAEQIFDKDSIVYEEKDVIILLQMLKEELLKNKL